MVGLITLISRYKDALRGPFSLSGGGLAMVWTQTCSVCDSPLTRQRCAICGADAVTVQEVLLNSGSTALPTLWQMLWRRNPIVSPVSEALWSALSTDFQESLLREYRSARRRASMRTAVIMLPLVVALMATCFWSGVVTARWFGIVGAKEYEWMCGVAATLVLLPVRVFPLGACVEGFLLRRIEGTDAPSVLCRAPLVELAVMCRCPIPWYVNPDVLFPFSVGLVFAMAWQIL